MKGFKLDTHVHTFESSHCGKVPAKEVVKLYKNNNYSGIIITDHYYKELFEQQNITWNKKIDNFLTGYLNAKKEGNRLGIAVFLGMEITFTESGNDYLVYGIDENFLYNNKELYKLGIKNFSNLIKNKHMLVYQAHPFRHYCSITSASYLDGIEVHNANPRHDSSNHLALEFAQKNDLKQLSGSDFHRRNDLGGGVILPQIPKTSKEFVTLLKNENIIDLIRT